MRAVCVFCLFLGVSEAILASGRAWAKNYTSANHGGRVSADSSGRSTADVGDRKTADYSDKATADQILPQESHERSVFYNDYIPDEPHGGLKHGYPHHYPHHHYTPQHYHYEHESPLKALLLPLAGVALLGAAAVFASNPVLLQLGVVSGRRRRRDLQESRDMLVLERLVSQLPQEELARQERRLLANYLSCSGVCLERLACEVFQPGASVTSVEQHFMHMIISGITNNEFVGEEFKNNIVKARKAGHFNKGCKPFPCLELDKMEEKSQNG